MKENKTAKRAWVKDAAIIFLTVMLILTFFSSTILNWSLPEVSGQYAGYGTITTTVRGTGTVQTNMAYEVQIDETREIKKVLVKSGDKVEAGDVLVLLEDSDGTELESAKDALKELEYNYRAKLLSGASGSDAEADQTVRYLREDLAKAVDARDRYEEYEAAYEQAKDAYETLSDELETLREEESELSSGKSGAEGAEKAYLDAQKDLKYLEEDFVLLQENQVKYKALKSAYEAALKEVNAAKKQQTAAQEDYDEAYSDYKSYTNVTDKEIADAKKAYDNANTTSNEYSALYRQTLRRYNTYEEARQERDEAQLEYEALVKDPDADAELIAAAKDRYDEARGALAKLSKVSQTELDYAMQQAENADRTAKELEIAYESLQKQQSNFEKDSTYVKAKNAYEKAKEALDACKDEVERLQEKADDAQAAMNEVPAVTDSDISSARRNIERKKDELVYLKADYEDAIEVFYSDKTGEGFRIDGDGELSATINDAVKSVRAKIKAKEKETEAAKKVMDRAQEKVTSTPDALDERVRSLERDLENALLSQETKKESAGREDQLAKLELERLNGEIAAQRAKVKKLQDKAIDAEVRARYAGTITAVNVIAGDKASAGSTLLMLDVDGKGYTLTMPVTSEQSRIVHVGDKAKILNYWGGNIDVTLAAIKVDRSNPATGKILEFDVTGDVTDGQSLNLSVGERRNSYDLVVPNSAVREDSNGTFILIASAKNTPLGNRFIAKRVDVTVISKDSTYSALDAGTGYGYEYVIVNSTAPLTDGMQVRLVNK